MYKHASRLPRNHSAGHINSNMSYAEYNKRRQQATPPKEPAFGNGRTKVAKRDEMRGVARDTSRPLTHNPFVGALK